MQPNVPYTLYSTYSTMSKTGLFLLKLMPNYFTCEGESLYFDELIYMNTFFPDYSVPIYIITKIVRESRQEHQTINYARQ